MKSAWVYVVAVVTLALAAAYIAHLRLSEIPDLAIGHSSPPPQLGKPAGKLIDYQVDGPENATATLSYLDDNGQVRNVSATLPWRTSLSARKLTLSTSVVVQSDADQVSCRISVNGEIRDSRSSGGPAAAVSCRVDVS